MASGTRAENWSPKFGKSEIGGQAGGMNWRTEARGSNQKEARQSNHKKGSGWTVEPGGGWVIKPQGQRLEDLGPNERIPRTLAEVWTREAGPGGRRYLEHNLEDHGQRGLLTEMSGGKVMMNERKKSKMEEGGWRELAGDGIKSWKGLAHNLVKTHLCFAPVMRVIDQSMKPQCKHLETSPAEDIGDLNLGHLNRAYLFEISQAVAANNSELRHEKPVWKDSQQVKGKVHPLVHETMHQPLRTSDMDQNHHSIGYRGK
ncbi:hypothetical protein B0H14DRAFT_2651440 [Mycena olivaceomarginata]|nr:hypothetical protein B0H14DRAFT_2651440 [Mycena olivaceomarginata]